MGVDVHRRPDLAVAEPSLDDLRGDAEVRKDRGLCMPQAVERKPRDACFLRNAVEFVLAGVVE